MLTTEQATIIAQETLAEAKRRGFAPLCCAVLDPGGHPLAVLRDEAASISRAEIATAKAAGCLGMGFGGRELAARAEKMPQFFNALATVFPKGIVAVPGGALLRDASGALVGAVGVSGDTSDNDEIALLAAVEKVGLKAQTGAKPE